VILPVNHATGLSFLFGFFRSLALVPPTISYSEESGPLIPLTTARFCYKDHQTNLPLFPNPSRNIFTVHKKKGPGKLPEPFPVFTQFIG
jgi:hypothetical protein